MLNFMAGLAAQNEHFDALEPLHDDSNVNYKANQTGKVRAGKPVKPYMGKKKTSKKQRKSRNHGIKRYY